MNTIDTIMHRCTDSSMLASLADQLRLHQADFAQEEQNYIEALGHLKTTLPESFSPSIDEFIHASQTKVIANLLYAAYEGYRANLENFFSPCKTCFAKMDFTDYICDHLAAHFPVSLEASNTCDQFRRALPESCKEAEAAITNYYITLDVTGPKLAHYAGYILSNHLLPWVVPGYREDCRQTIEYQRELKKYMGYLPQ